MIPGRRRDFGARRGTASRSEGPPRDRWLLSYADLITLLFALFATLYASSSVDRRRAGRLAYSLRTAFNAGFLAPEEPGLAPPRGTPARPTARPRETPIVTAPMDPRWERVARRLDALTTDPTLAGKVQLHVEPRGVVLSLAEAGFFESGSADLRHGGRVALDDVGALLADLGDAEIVIEGHTDDAPVRGGRFASNWDLSTARASFVVEFLIERHGIDGGRLSAAGYAEHRPVATNATPEGRARNRRVDIVVR